MNEIQVSNNGALPFGVIDSAKLIFEVAGIKGNQLALALDKIYQRHTGYSALEVGEIELVASTTRLMFTPASIGARFGLKPYRVNDILAKAGFQRETAYGWEVLPLGEPYALTDGTSKGELVWDSSILDVFEELQRDD